MFYVEVVERVELRGDFEHEIGFPVGRVVRTPQRTEGSVLVVEIGRSSCGLLGRKDVKNQDQNSGE